MPDTNETAREVHGIVDTNLTIRTQGKTSASTKLRWRKGKPASGWPATDPHKVKLPDENYQASLDYHEGVNYLTMTPSAHAIQKLLTTQESNEGSADQQPTYIFSIGDQRPVTKAEASARIANSFQGHGPESERPEHVVSSTSFKPDIGSVGIKLERKYRLYPMGYSMRVAVEPDGRFFMASKVVPESEASQQGQQGEGSLNPHDEAMSFSKRLLDGMAAAR